jgi:hypothetical protein
MQTVTSYLFIFIYFMIGCVVIADEARDVHDESVQTDGGEGHSFKPLFPDSAALDLWVVTRWDDVGIPADEATQWTVRDGVLYGSDPRGTWLMSKAKFTNFELQFEFKLGEHGNSGLALRAPMRGDPAFDGMELQMADLRYNPSASDSELTGGIYRAIAPAEQVYQPTEWNRYKIRLVGSHLHVTLNGTVIHDTDLEAHHEKVTRHDGSEAPSVSQRPRTGHIGFQELSRGGSQVQIRKARIRELPTGNE